MENERHNIGQLPRPAAAGENIVVWPVAATIVILHLAALLAFLPWFFSWTGVVVLIAGFYVYGTLGINLGFHRLLTHRGFRCPKWLEHVFATLGVLCLQGTPARWVMAHRLHHQNSDEQLDPHSPMVSPFWGHMGWLIIENKQMGSISSYDEYARDILRDPFYLRFERGLLWFWVYIAQAGLYFLAGFVVGWLSTGSAAGGFQFGSSLVVWGVILRTVVVWHITWSVNSLTHLWGYQNYETRDNSRNNWLVALVSNGEGWHNNHHADQCSAAHGHRWWEFDVTYLSIRFLKLIGLADQIVMPRKRTTASAKAK